MAVKHVSFAGKLPAGMAPSRPTAKKAVTRNVTGIAKPMRTGMKGALAGGSAALSGARRGMSGGSTYGAGLGINSVPGQRISPTKHASLQRTARAGASARSAQLKKMNNQFASARRASASEWRMNDAKLYEYQLAKSGAKKAKKVLTKLKKRGV
jgi:hypothetical protein